MYKILTWLTIEKHVFFSFSFNLRIKMTWKVSCLEEAKQGKIVIYKHRHNLKHSCIDLLKLATSKTD